MVKNGEFIGVTPTELLAPDEPVPFALENADGRAPVLLVCDHASSFIPAALAGLGLDPAELARHIAWDIGAAEVTREMARCLDARALLSHFSRLVVDPNRWPEDPTLIPQISDGTIVPGNRDLSAAAKEARMACFHRAYHSAIDCEIEERLQRRERPALISIHSFTPVMRGSERPWEIGILWRADPRLPVPLMDRLRARNVTVGDNEPYSAREGMGYTLEVHADPRGLPNVLIELRQDLIDTHHGAVEWAELLAVEIRAILKDLDLRTDRARGVPVG